MNKEIRTAYASAAAPAQSQSAREWLNANRRQLASEGRAGEAVWPNLAGTWTGFYGGELGTQVVRIEQDGALVTAIKVTGDRSVPAGQVTWCADLRTMTGKGTIADSGFRNPQIVPGKLVIESPDQLQFTWEPWGPVTFRRGEFAEPRRKGSMLSQLFNRMFGAD